ncbi:MAG TPA: type III-B CRISPR module RAMP protein Cmr6 [candidate division Zixibacteria bacterium]|nr:type III-B CRISPR module RAMP protein Cmr6 [candidate division Zixibacteria bacterium]
MKNEQETRPIQACRDALQSLWTDPYALSEAAQASLLLDSYLSTTGDKNEGKKRLLQVAIKSVCGQHDIYTLAFDRWKKLRGSSLSTEMSVRGRLIVGLGAHTPLETGLTLHHTYGTPVIPGSALKGLAAHYCDEVWGPVDDAFAFNGDAHEALFGTQESAGHILFHDAWILPESLLTGRSLMADVMTPHHSDYYGAKAGDTENAPTDSDMPIPVSFLSVTGNFLICVECDDTSENGEKWKKFALRLLSDALTHRGVGAKTNSGYGRLIEGTEQHPAQAGQRQKPIQIQTKATRQAGDLIEVTRIETPQGREGAWFEAVDGNKGRLPKGVNSDIPLGQKSKLWIQSQTGNFYNLTSKPPKPRNPANKQKGRGRR